MKPGTTFAETQKEILQRLVICRKEGLSKNTRIHACMRASFPTGEEKDATRLHMTDRWTYCIKYLPWDLTNPWSADNDDVRTMETLCLSIIANCAEIRVRPRENTTTIVISINSWYEFLNNIHVGTILICQGMVMWSQVGASGGLCLYVVNNGP